MKLKELIFGKAAAPQPVKSVRETDDERRARMTPQEIQREKDWSFAASVRQEREDEEVLRAFGDAGTFDSTTFAQACLRKTPALMDLMLDRTDEADRNDYLLKGMIRAVARGEKKLVSRVLEKIPAEQKQAALQDGLSYAFRYRLETVMHLMIDMGAQFNPLIVEASIEGDQTRVGQLKTWREKITGETDATATNKLIEELRAQIADLTQQVKELKGVDAAPAPAPSAGR